MTDDQAVQAAIDAAFNDTLTYSSGKKRDWDNMAYASVLSRRNKAPMDIYLAAAEHYMYARLRAAQDGATGAAMMGLLIPGYDGLKGILQLFGKSQWLSTDGTQPSPATVLSVRWGAKGAVDGMTDYNKDNP